MAKKEKKNKKDKNSSSFFSNLNTDKSIEYGYAEKNPKSKWAKWIIAGLVLGATATGIAVPWSMSSCTLSLSQKYSNSRVMYYYIDPLTNNKVEVTYKEFEDRVNAIQLTPSIFDKWDETFYNSILESLYNEERAAYLKFRAIYKKLHGTDPKSDSFGASLDSKYSDIEKDQRKILEQNKKSFQKATNNDKGWLDKWIKELQTNSIYGPQNSETGTTNVKYLEEKAIDYMVSEKIKSSALARYNGTSITTDSWTIKDLNFANKQNPSNDKYASWTDDGGNNNDIKESEAVAIWKAYLTEPIYENTNSDNVTNIDEAPNVILPKQNSGEDNNKKIAVFQTKSYSTDFRNPLKTDKLFNELKSNFKFNIISSFKLTDINVGSDKSSPFTITSSALKALFKVSTNNGDKSDFIPASQISKFKGASAISTKTISTETAQVQTPNNQQNLNDKLLIQGINSSDEAQAKILGSSKIQEFTSLFKDSSSSSDSSSSLNLQNIAAFSSSLIGPTDANESNQLFSIKNANPIDDFFKLLFNINVNSGEIDFAQNPDAQTIWNNLNYGSKTVSQNIITLVKLLTENINKDTWTFKSTAINPFDFNSQLENITLSESDLSMIGKMLNVVFIDSNANIKTKYGNNLTNLNTVGYWTLYQLDAPNPSTNGNVGTYMYVASDGIKIFAKNSVNALEINDFRKMAINDLLGEFANGSADDSSSKPEKIYDVSSMMNKLNTNKLVEKILLSDTANFDKFEKAIVEHINNDKGAFFGSSNPTEIEIKAKANEIATYFKNAVSLETECTNQESINGIINLLSSSLKTLIDNNRAYDFASITLDTGEIVAGLQTQTKYGTDSIVKGQDAINDLFVQNIMYILSNKQITRTKAGGK